jgi:hypothetical protein
MWCLYTWNFTQPQRRIIFCFAGNWMEVENILLSKVSQAQKAKSQCSCSYEDYRPKTNAVILFDMVTHQVENAHSRNRERGKNLKIENG